MSLSAMAYSAEPVARFLLSEAEKIDRAKDFEDFSMAAQLFSGAMFSALVMYLVFSNGTRMSYIQRASLEKRLNVCCTLNIIVASLSAFLNFFQITQVDNIVLPGSRNMVVDVARPIEWILTCPVMQLGLVLMGGSRIPEYRRVLMPCLAATTLAFGTVTIFVEEPFVYVLYFCGLCSHSVQMFFNRQQILEHSKGAEGLLVGDSEFRKATLVLMLTWLPFPLWYILSPEGVGAVTSVAIIQMGWAFLNIISKFSLIFYIQRIKDNYCSRLKVKREMKGAFEGTLKAMMNADDPDYTSEDNMKPVNGDLRSCVVETLGFLGMSENIERFLRLLQQAQICSFKDLCAMTREDSERLAIPHDLVEALQKRERVWALEMVDDAERGLEIGEKHYSVNPSNECKKSVGGVDGPQSSIDSVAAKADPSCILPNSPAFDAMGKSAEQPYGFSNLTAPNGFSNPFPTSPSNWQGFNNGMANSGLSNWQGADVSSMAVVPLRAGTQTFAGEPSDKRLEQFENTIMDKFENKFDMIGKQMENKFEMMLENKFEMIGKQMEKSQNMLEAKVELIFSLKEKERQQSIQDTQSQHEQLHSQMAQAMEKERLKNEESVTHMLNGFAQQIIQESKATAFTVQSKLSLMEESQHKTRMEQEERMTSKIQGLLDDGVASIRNVVKEETQSSMERLQTNIEGVKAHLDGWAQHSIQESKANAFTFHTKISVMEEMQNKKQADQEDKIASKLQQLVNDGVESLRGAVAQQSVAQQSVAQPSMEQTPSSSKLEQMMSRMTSQFEGFQAMQLANRVDSDANFASKFDVLLARSHEQLITQLYQRMTEQSDKNTDKMHNKFEITIRETAERSTRTQMDGLKDLHRFMDDVTQNLQFMIVSVRSSANECVDKLSVLTQQISTDTPGGTKRLSPNGSSKRGQPVYGMQMGGGAEGFHQFHHG